MFNYYIKTNLNGLRTIRISPQDKRPRLFNPNNLPQGHKEERMTPDDTHLAALLKLSGGNPNSRMAELAIERAQKMLEKEQAKNEAS